jgi:predicted transcriptional regulator of viral defense system
MSTLNTIKKLKSLNIKLVTPEILATVLNTNNINNIYTTLKRLEANVILKNYGKGKYIFLENEANDFEIANLIIQPSYISFESALSFYGILSQFSYSVTSATIERSKKIEVDNKTFEYTKIDNRLFSGYIKENSFLMATKEKALFDYLYLASRGLRSTDVSEWDLSEIDHNIYKTYCDKIKFIPVKKLSKKLKLI